jgi:uncharacterized repeat protein (TIGR01451 family)
MLLADRTRRVLPLFFTALAGACLLAGVLALAPPRAEAVPRAGTPNQPWPTTCDVDVGLVVDRSNSILRDDPANPLLVRTAASGLVDRLTGTGARVAVWSFGTMASGFSGENPWYPGQQLGPADYPSIGFTALPDQAAGRAVHEVIDAIPFVSGAAGDPDDPDPNHAGSTNWEAALGLDTSAGPGAEAPDGSSPGDADVLIFFTDGNPTLNSTDPPAAPGGVPSSSDADVNGGIAAADAAKAGGTRIVAVGASLGGGLSVPNLQRVTGGYPGAVAEEDYILTDMSGLDQALFEVTTRFCGGSLIVRKLVPGAQPGEWVPEPGWRFETSFPDGTPAYVQPAAGGHQTGADGTVTHRWINAAGGTAVRVAESLAPGQALHHSQCAAAHDDEPDRYDTTTIDLDVPQNSLVLCEFYNYRPQPAIQVEKAATPTSVPAGGGDVTYTVTLTNPSPVDRVRLTALADDRFGDLFAATNPAVQSSTCADLVEMVVEPAGTSSCRFTARVDADQGDHVNVVTATGTEVRPDGTEGEVVTDDDDATVTATPAPDVAVVKDDGQTTVGPGDEVTYTLEATNHGTVDALGAVFSDELVEGAVFVAASDGGTRDGSTVTWPAVDIAVGQTVTRTITVRVEAAARDGAEVSNVATVDHPDDPNRDDNSDDDINEVVRPDGPHPRLDRGDPAQPRGPLPRTGSDTRGWALIGLGLASTGVAALLAGRLRQSPLSQDRAAPVRG